MLVYGRDREVIAWAAARLGIRDFGPASAIGVARDGALVAAAVYHFYRHPNIEITFATSSPRWASPGTVRAIFRYPFRQLGVARITAITDAQNQPARAFLERVGFHQEGYHPEVLPTGDAVSYGMLRRDCRWL